MKLKVAVLVGALALLAGAAYAEVGTTWFGIQGGGSLPLGNLKDFAETGFQGGAFGTYMVTKEIGIGADVAYHQWAGSKTVFEEDAEKLTETVIQATVHGVYMYPMKDPKMMPYAKVGVGLYSFKATWDLEGMEDKTYSKFGFNAGAGFNYQLSPMYTLGLSAAWHGILGGEDFELPSPPNKIEYFDPSLVTVAVNFAWGMNPKK